MSIGFKNSADGSVGVTVDACRAARTPHVFLSVGKEGLSSIIETGKREKSTSGWILGRRRQSVVRQGGLNNGWLGLLGHPSGEPLHQPLQILLIVRLSMICRCLTPDRAFGLRVAEYLSTPS